MNSFKKLRVMNFFRYNWVKSFSGSQYKRDGQVECKAIGVSFFAIGRISQNINSHWKLTKLKSSTLNSVSTPE